VEQGVVAMTVARSILGGLRGAADRERDYWPVVVFAANVLQIAIFFAIYPNHLLDPDLLAYLTYFRNWVAGDQTLNGIAYFTHPKALLVFSLGALGTPLLALAVTALVSAALGTLVYVISRDQFGRTSALIISAFLLIDPSKAILTLKSGADLYIACFLFAAIYLLGRGRVLTAGVCLFLSALVKPVTVPCLAAVLLCERGGRRRWLAAGLPLLALPLIAWANYALLGSAHGTDRFFEEFAALRGGDSVGPDSVFHFALWTQLVKSRFIATAAWGFVGLVLWIGIDQRRLLSPLFLVPLLFLIGYFLLGFASRFMPFFRFFWPLEVWFLMFVVYGAVETGTRLAGTTQAWMRSAVVLIVAVLLADNFIVRQIDYRRDFALPFEQSMRFAADAERVLRSEGRDGQGVLIPLALLPYMMWEFPQAARTHRIETAERIALNRHAVDSDWILYLPRIYASDAAREWLPRAIEEGNYEVRASDGDAALLARPGVALHAAPAGGTAMSGARLTHIE
jgi:hypothetical protein